MLNHDVGHAQVGRHAGKELLDRFQSAGRSADAHDARQRRRWFRVGGIGNPEVQRKIQFVLLAHHDGLPIATFSGPKTRPCGLPATGDSGFPHGPFRCWLGDGCISRSKPIGGFVRVYGKGCCGIIALAEEIPVADRTWTFSGHLACLVAKRPIRDSRRRSHPEDGSRNRFLLPVDMPPENT